MASTKCFYSSHTCWESNSLKIFRININRYIHYVKEQIPLNVLITEDSNMAAMKTLNKIEIPVIR